MKGPLGLPDGSVRAIIAILVVAAGFAYWLIYKDLPAELATIVTGVVFYYIGIRQGVSVGEAKEIKRNGNTPDNKR